MSSIMSSTKSLLSAVSDSGHDDIERAGYLKKLKVRNALLGTVEICMVTVPVSGQCAGVWTNAFISSIFLLLMQMKEMVVCK